MKNIQIKSSRDNELLEISTLDSFLELVLDDIFNKTHFILPFLTLNDSVHLPI
jgi:hypothetical protein